MVTQALIQSCPAQPGDQGSERGGDLPKVINLTRGRDLTRGLPAAPVMTLSRAQERKPTETVKTGDPGGMLE